MNQRTHNDAGDILFKFTCVDSECDNEEHVDIWEILEVGTPMCCDKKMDISDRYTIAKVGNNV